MKNILSLLVAVVAVLASGCATGPNFSIYVSGLTRSESVQTNKTFNLLPGNNDVDNDDLEFIEYANYMEKALSQNGFVKALPHEAPDIYVFIAYGIGNPRERTGSVPIFGSTGGGTSTFNANTYSTSGSSSTSGTITTPSSFGVVGSSSYSYTNYDRFLKVGAVDGKHYRDTKDIKYIWETDITSSGTSGDLRRVFPILVAAGSPYFGKKTSKAVKVSMTENQQEVKEIKGILEPEKEGE